MQLEGMSGGYSTIGCDTQRGIERSGPLLNVFRKGWASGWATEAILTAAAGGWAIVIKLQDSIAHGRRVTFCFVRVMDGSAITHKISGGVIFGVTT